MTTDALLFYLYGPGIGKRQDMKLYRDGRIDAELKKALVIDGQQFWLYGDADYIIRPWLWTSVPGEGASAKDAAYNTAMSSVWEAVEWKCKDMKQTWSSGNYKRHFKVREAPNNLQYKAAVLLWNFHLCMNGGVQVSSFFKCAAPGIAEYLAG